MDQQIQQSIYEAIDVVVNKKNSQLQFDRTIDCVIEEVKNLTTGEYKVRYLDEAFSAYATDGANYKVGKIVQVLIPQNDMSQRKTILGEKKNNSEETEEVLFNEERYSPVGLPFEKIYFNEIDSNDLVEKNIMNKCFEEQGIYGSYTSNKKITIFKNELNESMLSSEDINYNEVLRKYAKDQTMFMVTAEFKTRWLYETVVSGEYGIEFIFENIEAKTDEENFRYYITSLDLIGNPYKKINYSPVNFVFPIDGNKIKSLKEINLYSRYFKRQNSAKEDIDSKIAEEVLSDIWDNGEGMSEIFVKNISMSFCQETQFQGYSVQIVYPRGQYASLVNAEGLQLKAEVRYDGALVENTSSFQYYWFKRNIQVSLGHEKYNEIGGIGWELVVDKNQSLYTGITINSNEISKEFKSVVICDGIKISDTGILYREFSKDPQGQLILSHNGQGGTIEAILNNYDTTGLIYHWSKEDSFGIIENYSSSASKINIITSNIIDYNIYRCQVLKAVGSGSDIIEVITLELYVYNSEEDKEYDVIFNVSQNGTYVYDTAGDLYPVQKFQEPNTSQSIDFSIPQNIGDFSYKWIFPEANNSLILSINGLLKGNNRTNNGKSSIEFTIDKRYDYTKAINNQIELQITTNKQSKSFYYNLSFVKEGDPGTNGTSILMKIKYADGSVKALFDNSKKVGFQADVFYNGANVSNEFTFSATIPKDYKENNPLEENYFVKKEGSNNIFWIQLPNDKGWTETDYNSIFQIKAVPNEKSEIKHLFPYAILGLQAVPFTNSSSAVDLLPKGTFQVIYSADGYSPSYPKIQYEFTWAESTKLIGNDGNQGELKDNFLRPKEQYLGKDTRGAIKFVKGGNFYIHPIVYMANAFSKELLNAWDGSSVQIDGENGFILAPQIGAGLKNGDNKFTGVLMGQYIGDDTSLSKKHGLYGFSNGVATFAFKDDGTAFIGAPGGGRIEFNGNKGIIQSNNFKDADGMQIDLQTGIIEAYNFKLISSALTIDSKNKKFNFALNKDTDTDDAETTGVFVVWGKNSENEDVRLLNISNKNMYLQSANYTEDNKLNPTAGMKIDLTDGSIKSKGFKINSSGAYFAGDITGSKGEFSGSLKIGDNFTVTSDGKLTAKTGTIGGWSISSTGFSARDNAIKLSTNGDLTMDGTINLGNNKIVINSDGVYTNYLHIETIQNSKTIALGKIGYLAGKTDHITNSTTTTLGIVANKLSSTSIEGYSIVLETPQNIRLTAGSSGYTATIYLNADKLETTANTFKGFHASLA